MRGVARVAIARSDAPYRCKAAAAACSRSYNHACAGEASSLLCQALVWEKLSTPSVASRAGWFVEKHRGQLEAARESGVLASMLDPLDLAVPMIATNDIGTTAAMLLQRELQAEDPVGELAMGLPSSMNDVAAALSIVLERPVTAQVLAKHERVAV